MAWHGGSLLRLFFATIVVLVALVIVSEIRRPRIVQSPSVPKPHADIKDATTDPLADFLANHPQCHDKAFILRQLQAVGVNVTIDICNALPQWKQITERFGERPYVLGRGTCQKYRDQLAKSNSSPRPRIAGLPNTPVEMMAQLLQRIGLMSSSDLAVDNFTVPWGAHTPLSTAKKSMHFDPSVFPIVLVRDPILFMHSLCSHPNGLRWSHGKQGRCPNLIPIGDERKSRLESTFRVQYSLELHDDETTVLNYKSIADFWVSWIDDWSKADTPRLIIRSEDLFLFPEHVLAIVSECLGNDIHQPQSLETYPILEGIKQYTSVDRNVSSLTRSELDYLFSVLKPSIMLALHYERNDLAATSSLNDSIFLPSQFTNKYSRWKPKTQPSTVTTTDDSIVQECHDVAVFLAQNPRCDDKVHLIEELASAGVCPQPEFCDQLPTWQQVTDLYGDKPVILGLETCDAYKRLLKGSSPMPKLTALWNSGSTALSKTFLYNMQLYDAHWTIDRATVTWGKVSPHNCSTTARYPRPHSRNLPWAASIRHFI